MHDDLGETAPFPFFLTLFVMFFEFGARCVVSSVRTITVDFGGAHFFIGGGGGGISALARDFQRCIRATSVCTTSTILDESLYSIYYSIYPIIHMHVMILQS